LAARVDQVERGNTMFPILTFGEFASFLRRRWLVIVVVAILGAAAGVTLALRSERVYEAAAVVQIVSPVIAREDGPAVGATVTRRIQSIEQQLMSRDSLLALAARHNMFDGGPLTPSERAELMRRSLRFLVLGAASGSPDEPPSAIVIFANAGEPDTAAAIANELADTFVRETASSRQDEAQRSLEFFQQEVSRLEADIVALEGELALFQTQNQDVLPASLTPRREEARRIEEVRLTIQREVVQAQNELSGLDASSTRAVTQRRIEQLNDQIAGRERELQLLDARLEQLSALFQRAPEVAREMAMLERSLTQVQAQLTAAQERRREAELGQRIEEGDQAERFLLFESALAPEYPVSRSRRVIVMAATFGGLVMGAVLALGMEFARPVLRTAARMEREMQLRPVVSIPYTIPPSARRRRSRMVGGGLALALAVAVIAVMLVFGR
jgi:tyrosine-protein kinase Etk/Wzc